MSYDNLIGPHPTNFLIPWNAKNPSGLSKGLRRKYDYLIQSNYKKRVDLDYLLLLARQTGYDECLDNEAQNCEEY